ncbi:MAG: alpha/beta fold hydrolase [Chitinophagaceae bacterium]|nr:alpha/beta fold hydrolase [Chitinophagaceae bacterium]
MELNHIRYGNGQPLLLIHGLGGSWKSWIPVIDRLAAHREIIAIDLPGHGKTPKLDGPTSISSLADSISEFIQRNGLTGIDAVGSSMGGRLVLELARRRGFVGAVVSLNPGGFWQGWQRHFFYLSLAASIRLIRSIQFMMPALTKNVITRSILLAQFSPKPWNISSHLSLAEMRSYNSSPVFDELLYKLAYGEEQQGAEKGSINSPLVIGWGRQDRVCFPLQAKKALQLFPDAQLHVFKQCGHFPHWDRPAETAELILRVTAATKVEVKEHQQDS